MNNIKENILFFFEGVNVGLNKENGWVFSKGNSVFEYNRDEQFEVIFWLPILTGHSHSFYVRLETALNGLGKIELLKTFPMNNTAYGIKERFRVLSEFGAILDKRT